MAIEIEPSEPDLRNIRKHLRQGTSARGVLGWGGLALLALSALVLTSQTQSGSERLQQALGSIANEPVAAKTPEPVRTVAGPASAKDDGETRRLEAQLRALEADRDRLTARIATLERNLEDMTGSIRAQAERPVPVAPAAAAPMPVPSAPLTIPETRAPDTRSPQASAPDTAPPSVAPPAVPAPATPPQASAPALENVPMPPVRVAVARPTAEPPPVRAEYGIDLGGAPNADALRARWAAVKANFGPLLSGLHPVAVRDRRPGSTELRLVVGPLPNAAAARDLCARVGDQAACRTGRYDGEAFIPR